MLIYHFAHSEAQAAGLSTGLTVILASVIAVLSILAASFLLSTIKSPRKGDKQS